MHLPALVWDLALILTVAGLMALLCRWLRQPTVLGFLAAGILVGPEITLIPTVLDRANVQIWADLGVIFLLFVLGLEFSFRKLVQVGRTSLIAAAVEVTAMTLVGWALGQILGWNSMDSIFLGGILAISSTTIILKAFQELGVRTQRFAAFVFGILVIEDLFAILLLVFLSTVGATKELQGLPLLRQVAILIGFLVGTISIGKWLLPKFLRLSRSFLTDELRVVVFLAFCLALACASTAVGLSSALGAFLIGSLIGDTAEGERVERLLKPVRDLFAAVFFTSVGSLLDLQSVAQHWRLVLLIAVVTIVGKFVTTAIGMLAAGHTKRVSIQSGLSLAQIGEFSFIIGMLGLSLGVIRAELYPLAVAVSVITTFTTPYLIKIAVRIPTSDSDERTDNKSVEPRLWDGHLVEFEIHPHSRLAGRTLAEIGLREKFGVSIVSIHRGDLRMVAPARDQQVMPYDRLVALGTDAQLSKVENHLWFDRYPHEATQEGSYDLAKVVVTGDVECIGKTLRDSGLRDKVDGLVLGIERGEQRILNPNSDFVIQEKDVLWIYGRRDRLREFGQMAA